MTFKTISGATSADVLPTGVLGIRNGIPLTESQINNSLADGQAEDIYSQIPGVQAGGVCTVSGLNVTIPTGTRYFARTTWETDAAVTVAVPNGATTYLWGCADGAIRTTSTTTPPTGFDARSACILAKATASGGAATLDATAQHHARAADPTTRKVTEGPLSVDYAANEVRVNGTLVGPDSQSLIGTTLKDGTNTITQVQEITVVNGSVAQTAAYKATLTIPSGGGGGSAALATNAVSGTVKTNVTDADPVVYTKAAVDTLLGGKSAVGHTHAESDVLGLTTDLGNLAAQGNANATALTTHQADANAHPQYARSTDLSDHKTAATLDHPDGSISTAKLAAGAVTAGKIASKAVGTAQIADTPVTPGSYTNGNFTVGSDGRLTAAANGSAGGGSLSDASTSVKGIAKLSVAPVTANDPIAVGNNDSRMSDARTPTAHATAHAAGAADALSLNGSQITAGTIGAARLPAGTTSAQGALQLAADNTATAGQATDSSDTRLGAYAEVVAARTEPNAAPYSGSTFANLKARLDALLNKIAAVANRAISPGTGLTGGGNLTADRTIALDVAGATTGQVLTKTAGGVGWNTPSSGGSAKLVLSFTMAGGLTPGGAGAFGAHVRVPENAAGSAATFKYELIAYVGTTPSGSTTVALEQGSDFSGSGGFGSATTLATLTFGSTAPKTSFASSGTVSTDNFLRLNAAAPGGAGNYSVVLILREQ